MRAMFAKLKEMFAASEDAAPVTEAFAKASAAASLFCEAAASDGTVGEEELARIETLLNKRFGLEAANLKLVLDTALKRQANSIEISAFTREAKTQFSPEERIDLMEMLWEVAYADGVLDDFEANLMRRLGGLLYVEDRDSGAARKRALATLGLTQA